MKKGGEAAVAAAGAAALFLLYWALRSPSYGPGDSAQHALSALTLGVSRPPGYPLYNFLAHGFARIVPGSGASAVGAFSGFCEALACWLLYWALRGQGCRPASAAAGAALMAFAPVQWFYAEVPEVRALNHALALGALLCLRRGLFWGAAACVGLGLSHHPTFLFIAPSLALAAEPKALRPRPAFAAAALVFLALPYAFLLLRLSAGRPAYNPDAVAGLSGVVELLLRRDSGGLLRAAPGAWTGWDTAALLRQAGWFCAAALRELTAAGLLLAAAGAFFLRGRRAAAVWAAWILVPAAAYIALSSQQMKVADTVYARGLVERFFALPMLGLFALAGFGVELAAASAHRTWLAWAVTGALAARAVLAPVDLRSHEPLKRYVDDILAETAPGDVIVPVSDDTVFALEYARLVEGRLQGRVVLMPWLLDYAPYMSGLEGLKIPVEGGKASPRLEPWLAANPGKAFFQEGADPTASGRPTGVLVRTGEGEVDAEAAARRFLESSLGRLDRWQLKSYTQEVFLAETSRRQAQRHLSRLPGGDGELEGRLRRVLAGL